MHTWQAQEAKAKFSQLVKISSQTPQCITVHGEEAAFIVSPGIYHEYEEMKLKASTKRKYKTVGDFMRQSSFKGVKFSDKELERLFGRDSITPARGSDEPLFD